MIDIKNLNFTYQNRTIFENFSLNIKSGESVAFMGANGCGKSTLFKIISGLIFGKSGTYNFDGEKIDEITMDDPKFSKNFYQKLGFIFQNSANQLFCASVFEEIAFGMRQLQINEDEIEKRVNELLELLDIKKLKNEVPFILSGGEKKKVAIAATLATNPKLLLFDEPLAALDCKSQRELIWLLKELIKQGKTIIFASHNLNFVKEVSKRVILFAENGKVLGDDNSEKICSQIELLKQANVVDPFYHAHGEFTHSHS